ncbi:MAG: hypothetical protein QM739_17155 [Propionivibrio sp.]
MHLDQRQQHVLARGEVRKQVVGLEDGADAAPVGEQVVFVEGDFAAVDGKAAGIGRRQPGDDAQQSRLATARGTDDRQRVEIRQRKSDAAQRLVLTEGFGDLLCLKPHSGISVPGCG